MYIAMLKKELKQFFRSKGNVILLFIFPIMLITTLAVGLKDMMNVDGIFEDDNSSIVYYTLDKESKYKDGFIEFTKSVEESVNIKFHEEASLSNIKSEVDDYKAIAYINIEKDEASFYSSDKGEKTKQKIFKEIFESFLKEYAVYETIGEFNPVAFTNFVENKYDEYVIQDDLAGTRGFTSGEFYTFAELALIILFVGQTIGESVYKETQLKTINRIRLSKVSESTMIAAKVSLGIVISTIQTLLIYAYTSLFLDIDWGENTFKFILLFIVFGIFASVVGAIVGCIAKKDSTVTGGLNAIIFVICALGGCFTPLSMIISIPVVNKLVYLSPVYWITTATSTMICGIDSGAYYIALAIPIILSVLCLISYLLIIRKKGGLANA